MSPILNVKNIFLSQIDFEAFDYSLSPERDVAPAETLYKSIARHGILHLPIVRECNSDLHTIVAGRKRLLALRSLHTETACTCLVISRQVPEIDIFSLLLDEIQLTRPLTMVEKAIFLHKTTAIADARQIISEFLPRLGLAPHSFSLQQTLKLLDLEDPVLRCLHHGQISETVAHDLILMAARDRMALVAIIVSLRLSFSNQKKLLIMCRELAGRDNTSIATLLDNDEVQGILQHQDANPPQKTKNLMLWLSRRHMPRCGQAAEEFNRFITAMRLPQNASVEHTPFFEDDSMTLSITFPNRESLQHAWEKIRYTTDSNNN
jgi:hypothetical protein